MDIKAFFSTELVPLPPGQPLARWATIISIHRRYVELGGKLSRPAFLVEIEHEFPEMVFSDLGRNGRKIPYRLASDDEQAIVQKFADEKLERVEPLGRGVPRVRTANRKQSDWATVTELHRAYADWAFENGHRPLGLVRFGRALAVTLGASYPLYRFGASRLPCVIR